MCRYCERGDYIVDVDEWGGNLTACIEDGADGYCLSVGYACNDPVYDADSSAKILYCPMCGRKLAERGQ